MDQKYTSTKTKRIATKGGYPKLDKLYLGAHMVNDINWGKDKEEVERDSGNYNVYFTPDLALEVKHDVEPGNKLFVYYNYDGKAFT